MAAPTPTLATKPFSLLVKPASADCNLACAYCFYLDRCELYPDTKTHRMSDEVLEAMISRYMATPQPAYSIGWQGGEPTLMGVEFFRKVTDLQQRYGRSGAVVSNGLQTNATLIDDEFAEHLAKYHFLVGVSIDGPQEVHDTYRTTVSGRGSHAAVMKGIDALNRQKVDYNALVLVSSANVHRAAEVYRYLVDLGIYYHQYIPCVEFDEAGTPLPFTITGEEWGDFLCEIFDTWAVRDTRRVSIRLFDAVVLNMVTGERSMCTMGGNCTQYFVVEHNGDVYPCDFFVEKQKRLGNITRDEFAALSSSSRYRKFGAKKSEWNNRCSSCRYLEYCSGDCLKQRYQHGENPAALSWLCEGWQKFYGHTIPAFEKLAVSVLNERQAQAPPHARQHYDRLPRRKIGWNDPCYCGSGKKYRECHGAVRAKR
jgi:uncharacterized protein